MAELFMIILAIETSCDETSAAVIDGDRVISSVVWSQIKYHRKWGGVVPSIARRAHEERLPVVVANALARTGIHLSHGTHVTNGPHVAIEAIAVTIGPGLAPALEVGIAYAKKLAIKNNLPLIPVNHLEGHIASALSLQHGPHETHVTHESHALSLVVSGGHTELVRSTRIPNTECRMGHSEFSIQNSVFRHVLLGQTLDDAAGECIDKVGRELGLGYPAGPVVEKLAREASKGLNLYARLDLNKFPIPMERSPRQNLNFSFSGLKTAAVQILNQTHDIKRASQRQVKQLSKQQMCDFCAAFQKAVIDALLLKLKRAMKITGIKTVFLSGGVAANNQLRRRAGILVRSLDGQFLATPKKFTGDNAAMIGLAAQWAAGRGEIKITAEEISQVDRIPNLNFSPLIK